MALPTTRLYTRTSLAIWVHCGVFVLACISPLSIASSGEPFRTVADYPKGCYAGPGPAEGDTIELLHPSCIFSQKGQRSDGVYQETGGIVIRTNMAGKWGEMRIQVNLMENHTSGETKASVVPVSVASTVDAHYPEGKKARFPWYGIKGFASSKQMELLATPEQNKGSDLPLYVWNILRMEKLEGGWKYHITFTAAGDRAGKIFNFTRTIVNGVLHDRV
ncbi:hypothetical protein FOZ60_016005 [Perkinsus olseni]|uniref:Uncharacterized protein n=1 Tax=Perkinsus olseni TaxID=32597 RepID=A0A7J6P4W9_PEROL|nr:hypothetical protein FOZ60_016005 [Perkinsus olseni]KAF4709896.1 hypothetical protein FOZ62_022773 [Perkinsus olseni]